jgi:Arc/MetJ-type ribon-helix-helix transcriptional regulator
MKARIEARLPSELVERIDRLVGARKRSEFIEKALSSQLQRETLNRLFRLADTHLKGLTLEDTYYISRAQLEERGGQSSH